MKALITGASSGIGKDMAIYLSELGYDIILVSREEDKLKEVKSELKTKSKIIVMDLKEKDNCIKLYEMTKKENIDILVNNAGFGEFGEFVNTPLQKELDMIDVNVVAVHILTKLFLKDFVKRDSGYILNVSSSATLLKFVLTGPGHNTLICTFDLSCFYYTYFIKLSKENSIFYSI